MNATITPAVRARNLRKHFGEGPTRVEVLRGVNFDAFQGQLTFLVGPSGCGKTTLISVIAGLLQKINITLKINRIFFTFLRL